MDFFMKEVKSFCKNDDTCLFLILVLLGFLICMFFSRNEGFLNMGDIDELEKELEHDLNKSIGKEPQNIGLKVTDPVPTNGYGYEIGNKYNLAKMGKQYRAHGFDQMEGKLDRQDSGLPMPWANTHHNFTFTNGSNSKFGFDRPLDSDLGTVRPSDVATVPSNYKGGSATVEGFANAEMIQGVQPSGGSSSGMAPLDAMSGGIPKPAEENILDSDKKLENELHLVLFYSPSCGHCKRMLDDYNSVIDSHHGKVMNNVKLHVVKVDMIDKPDGAKPYNVKIQGFPTLHTFKKQNGTLSDGEPFQPRKKDKIISEITKRINEF